MNWQSPIPRSNPQDSKCFRRGVGLAELLIALAISAMLLTATAVAIDASFKSYRINEEQASLIQKARLAANRILANIRQTEAHAPYTTSLLGNFTAGQTVTDTGIQMYDDAGTLIKYYFDGTNQRLMMRSGATTRTLVEGVTAFSVTLEPMRSATAIRTGGGYDQLSRATLLLSVRTTASTAMSSETTGNQVVTISTSVMPRRNVW